MGLCDAASGKVSKENFHKSGQPAECQKFIHRKMIVVNLNDDDVNPETGEGKRVNRGRGDPAYIDGVEQPYDPSIGEHIVQRPEEFWMICDDGVHVNGQWCRRWNRIPEDEFLQYRVHYQRVTFPLYVYCEPSDTWFENEDDRLPGETMADLRLAEVREALRPDAPTVLLGTKDMIKVANGGAPELLLPDDE